MESSVLVKAFQLLEAFGQSPTDPSLAALSSQTGLAKPTVHRILKTLVALGYVEQTTVGIYRLSRSFRRLTLGRAERLLVQRADPLLRALRDQTGETVNLGVLQGHRVTYLTVLESNHALRRIVEERAGDPFHTTALGRAMVAFLSDQRREFLLRTTPLEKYTPATVNDPVEIQALLDEVRQAGFAVEEDQTDVGVTCIGAPVFQGETVVAAISVSVPTARIQTTGTTRQQLIDAVCKTANALTELMTSTEPTAV